VSFGSEKVADVGGIQEGFNQIGHGGFVTELGRITFNGSVSDVVHDAMGQSRLADTRWAVEKGGYGCPRSLGGSPGHERIVMGFVEER